LETHNDKLQIEQ